MAGKPEYLEVQMKCDLCDYSGSGREVGAHIAHNHYQQLLREAHAKVLEAGRRGITRAGIEKATGWTPNRVASLTKSLERQGVIVSNHHRPLRYYDSSVKTKTNTRTTRGGGAVVSVESADVALPQMSGNKFIEEVNRKAMNELAKRHPDEFKKLFLASLIESKISTMSEQDIGNLLDATLNL